MKHRSPARSARCCAAIPGCSRAASRRQGRFRRDGARRRPTTGASSPGPRTARTRRSACAPGASTKPSASTPRSSSAASPRRSRCARACRSPATACAWCTARPTACRAWSSTATASCCRRSSSPPAPSAGRRRSPTRCCADRRTAPLRAQRHSARAARRPGAGHRLAGAARRAPTEVDDPRARAGASALDVASGHKTGFYLDQRDNRKLFAETRAPLRLRSAC